MRKEPSVSLLKRSTLKITTYVFAKKNEVRNEIVTSEQKIDLSESKGILPYQTMKNHVNIQTQLLFHRLSRERFKISSKAAIGGVRPQRWGVFFTKLRLASLLRKKRRSRSFSGNFAKFLRTPFYIEGHLFFIIRNYSFFMGIIFCTSVVLV